VATRVDLPRAVETIDLQISGMTCASCAARIERRLNKLDGVEASVNYATEAARVHVPAGIARADLVDQVEAAGYQVVEPEPAVHAAGAEPSRDGARLRGDDADELASRVRLCVLLSAPVLVMSMVPAVQFDHWQWISLVLAAPVVLWGGAPFHRAAWANLRHGAATMDTLISGGTLAALGWSVYALLLTPAGDPTCAWASTCCPPVGGPARDLPRDGRGGHHPHPGRPLLRGERQAAVGGSAPGAARTGGEGRGGAPQRRGGAPAGRRPGGRRPLRGAPRREGGHRRRRVEGSSAIDASLLTGEPVPVDVTVGDAVTGATVNASGRLVVEATRVGADTALARIARWSPTPSPARPGPAPGRPGVAVFVPVVMVDLGIDARLLAGAGARRPRRSPPRWRC
jgi:P-type Cu+ transporter